MTTHSTAGTTTGTTTGATSATPVTRDRLEVQRTDLRTSETKPSFKTTELLFYVLAVAGVLIASAVSDNAGSGGFGASAAWLYVTILTVGYMVSRGIAKSGSYAKDSDTSDRH